MLRIGVQFSSGRFHATPWGRHVNEGAVEWPPSPWRLGRALIATGFAKAQWTQIPEIAARAIVALASSPPVYYLPPATASHVRHYMPTFRTMTKVVDAFVYPGRSSTMVMEWDVALGDSELAMLDLLLGRMSYLGRAESWIEARRVDRAPDDLFVCAPAEAPPGPGYERVDLLGLMPAAEYETWRRQTRKREVSRRLERKRQRARELGRPRPRELSKVVLRRLEAELPDTSIEALCADTMALQKNGWNVPPGTRWLVYWRPKGALEPLFLGHGTTHNATREPHGPMHQVAVLAFSPGDNATELPPMRDALWQCETLHKALVRQSALIDPEGTPAPCFTGRARDRMILRGHQHTTFLPLTLGNRHQQSDHIDHIVLYTPMGLDVHALTALQSLHIAYSKELPPVAVNLVGVGRPSHFANRIPIFGAARIWQSHTPFVPPRYLKATGKHTLFGQVCSELEARGLPRPVAVHVVTAAGGRYLDSAAFWALWKDTADNDPTVVPGAMALVDAWRHYRKVRPGNAPKPPIDAGFGLRLTFAEPVHGPISIGYASHFGLGMFMPASCSS